MQPDVGRDDVRPDDVGQAKSIQPDVGPADVGQVENIRPDVSPDDVHPDDVGQAEMQPDVGTCDVGQVDNIQPDVSPDDVCPDDVGEMENMQPDVGPADIGPATNVRSRARKADPQKWKKNIRKRLRNSGLEYVNTRGMRVPKKVKGNVNCSHCKFKCSQKVTESDREAIFKQYWETSDKTRQRDFIVTHAIRKPKGRATVQNSRCKFSLAFYLTVNSTKVRVCKTFFCQTLAIGAKLVRYALEQCTGHGFGTHDRRGRHPPANKIPAANLDYIAQHIRSFPALESHYSRQSTTKRVFGSGFKYSENVRTIYN